MKPGLCAMIVLLAVAAYGLSNVTAVEDAFAQSDGDSDGPPTAQSGNFACSVPVTDDGRAFDVVWNATLVTYEAGNSHGCWYWYDAACIQWLTPRHINYEGANYGVEYLYLDMDLDYLIFATETPIQNRHGLELVFGADRFPFSDSPGRAAHWKATDMDWSQTDTVQACIVAPPAESPQPKVVAPEPAEAQQQQQQQQKTVTPNPPQPPVITLAGSPDMTIQLGSAWEEPGYAATDHAGRNITANVTVTGTVDTSVAAEYSLHYRVADSSGTQAVQQNRTVTVVAPEPAEEEQQQKTVTPNPPQPPVITLAGSPDMTIQLGSAWEEPGYAATDHAGRNITANVTVTGTVDTSVAAEYSLHYRVADSSGTQAVQQNRTVTVVAPEPAEEEQQQKTVTPNPPQPPVITLAGSPDMTIQLGSAWEEPGYAATDHAGRNITANVTVTGTVDTSVAAEYSLHYRVADSSGTQAVQQNRTVTVVAPEPAEEEQQQKTVTPNPPQPPVITLAGSPDMTIQLGSAWEEPGYAATDHAGRNITANVTVTGTVDTSVAAEYSLHYRVADSSGTQAVQQNRTVTVVAPEPAEEEQQQKTVTPNPPQPPVITLAGSPDMTIQLGSAWEEPGYAATDHAGRNITANVTVTGTVDTSVAAEYSLHYRVADSSGTQAVQQNRTVTVVAPEPAEAQQEKPKDDKNRATYGDDWVIECTEQFCLVAESDEPEPDPRTPVERYDSNGDGAIQEGEWHVAMQDYVDGELTTKEVLEVAAARCYCH